MPRHAPAIIRVRCGVVDSCCNARDNDLPVVTDG